MPLHREIGRLQLPFSLQILIWFVAVSWLVRSSHPEMFLRKGVLKIWSKFTGKHPCRSAISICNFIEIALQHGCSPVNLLHIFWTLFLKNTSGWLRLKALNIGILGITFEVSGSFCAFCKICYMDFWYPLIIPFLISWLICIVVNIFHDIALLLHPLKTKLIQNADECRSQISGLEDLVTSM